MSQFNLIDEAWIPVVRKLDNNRVELGIRDVLLQAKDIAVIEDPSPLVTAALHRFLLAVLYRALEGPTDIDQAKALFKTGLPADKIEAYLERWRERFWLFDERYPFCQVPSFKPKKWRAWAAIAVEHNADTAKVLFDHVNETAPGNISFAAATRWLVATQAFAVSTGKSEISHTGTAPSAGSMMAIPIGRNLLDTLQYCLVPQSRMVMKNDLALWEREPETIEYLKTKVNVQDEKSGEDKDRTVERGATGIVDLYLWRSRSAILRATSSGDISELGFASGIGYKESMSCDPMLGYAIKEIADKNTKSKMKKRFSIQFEEKGVWRDFDSLLPDSERLGPQVIEHAVLLAKMERDRFPKGVMVLGQRYFPPRPNIAFWRKEFFALPKAISGDRNIRHEVREMLADAENAANDLNAACDSFAKSVLSHGDRKVEDKDIKNFVQHIPASASYWSRLEAAFHDTLRHYTLERDSEEIRYDWLKTVRVALHDAWAQHAASVSTGDAWSIRALVRAEGAISKQLKFLPD